MSIQENILISRVDIWTLLSELSPAIVIGLKNPLIGLPRDDAQIKRVNSLHNLLAKDLIEETPANGVVQIKNENLIKVLNSIVNPKHSVLVTTGGAQRKQKTKTFHYDNQNIVVSLEEIGADVIIAEDTDEIVSEHITSPFNYEEYRQLNTTSLAPIELMESQINKIRDLMHIDEDQVALEILRDAKVNEAMVNPLLYALNKPDIKMGIAVFTNRNQTGYPVKPLGVLAQGNYLWTIEASNQKQDTAIIKHVSKKNLLNRITTILP